MKAHCVNCDTGTVVNVTKYEKEVQVNEDTNEEEEVVTGESTAKSVVEAPGDPNVEVGPPKDYPKATFVPYQPSDDGKPTLSSWEAEADIPKVDESGKVERDKGGHAVTEKKLIKLPALCPNCGSPTLEKAK